MQHEKRQCWARSKGLLAGSGCSWCPGRRHSREQPEAGCLEFRASGRTTFLLGLEFQSPMEPTDRTFAPVNSFQHLSYQWSCCFPQTQQRRRTKKRKCLGDLATLGKANVVNHGKIRPEEAERSLWGWPWLLILIVESKDQSVHRLPGHQWSPHLRPKVGDQVTIVSPSILDAGPDLVAVATVRPPSLGYHDLDVLEAHRVQGRANSIDLQRNHNQFADEWIGIKEWKKRFTLRCVSPGHRTCSCRWSRCRSRVGLD